MGVVGKFELENTLWKRIDIMVKIAELKLD